MPLSSVSMSLKLAAMALLTAVAHAIPAQGQNALILPTDDPFYTVPENLAEIRPGTILRHRKPPAPIAAFRVDRQNLKDTHQILYRTTDNFGNATATVLTVMVPFNADYGKVVSQQTAEDSANRNCAPSYTMQLASEEGGILGTIEGEVELILMDGFLNEGWIVVMPDYEGPEGQFLAASMAGHAVLDGVRALLASTNITGIKNNANVALNGYSGGAIATAFASELQPSYAPELKIVGASIGGPVPDILTAIKSMNKGIFSGLIPVGVQGLAKAYPIIGKIIDEQLLPQYKAGFEKAKTECSGTALLHSPFTDYFAQVKNRSIFTTEPVKSIMKANSQGQHVPTMPLFYLQSINDELSPVSLTDALIKNYCNAGASVEYTRDFVSDHATLSITGATLVLPWLRRVLNGEHVAGKCTTRSVFTTLTDNPVGVPKAIVSALKSLLGKKIGPGYVVLS
ncbi:hypothetical protein E4U30_002053 [Claviceps sp. LM220 group G6]|nr:hypothetical protein E4U30_002053 [Claviceps sp. LM220 group G6]